MSEQKYDPTVPPTGYMKKRNDPPLNPCVKCGAEVNANWTIRELHNHIATLEAQLAEIRGLQRYEIHPHLKNPCVKKMNGLYILADELTSILAKYAK